MIFTGTFNARKGAFDFCEVAKSASDFCEFTIVGNVTPDARKLLDGCRGTIKLVPRVPQRQLKQYYLDSDVFLLPTIEDGFAATISQAYAAGMFIIATRNCGAPDVLGDSPLGHLVDIRSPQSILEKLRWIADNRSEVAHQTMNYEGSYLRGWETVC